MKYILLFLFFGINYSLLAQFFFYPDTLNHWNIDTVKVNGGASGYCYSGFLKSGPYADTIHTQWIVICDTNNRMLSSMFFSPMGRASMNFDYSDLAWGIGILGSPDLKEHHVRSEPYHNRFISEEFSTEYKRLYIYENGLLSSRSVQKFLQGEWKQVEFEMRDDSGEVDFIMKLDDDGNGFSIQYRNGKPAEWLVFENFQELHK
jgi:hypothetical protein